MLLFSHFWLSYRRNAAGNTKDNYGIYDFFSYDGEFREFTGEYCESFENIYLRDGNQKICQLLPDTNFYKNLSNLKARWKYLLLRPIISNLQDVQNLQDLMITLHKCVTWGKSIKHKQYND